MTLKPLISRSKPRSLFRFLSSAFRFENARVQSSSEQPLFSFPCPAHPLFAPFDPFLSFCNPASRFYPLTWTLSHVYNLWVFFPDEPVPVEVVRELAALLATNGLSELTLESKGDENALRLSLERKTLVYAAPAPPDLATAHPVLTESGDAAATEASTPVSESQNQEAREIGAPCVGVYRSPKKALQVGDHVKSGQVIAVVESLHVPNEVSAPFDAQILEIPVLDGEGVEWGQTLLILEPAS